MNRDWRDKRVRDLFHELGEEDERLTPSFEGLLATATRHRRLPRRLHGWRVAAAVALPVIAVVLVLAPGNISTESLPAVDETLLLRLPHPQSSQDQDPALVLLNLKKEIRALVRERSWPQTRDYVSKGARRKSAARTQSIHISQWHAPTDFLLKLPGSEFLRNLPRMPDSPPGVASGLPENHN